MDKEPKEPPLRTLERNPDRERLFREIEALKLSIFLDISIYGTAYYRIGNGTVHHICVQNGTLLDVTRIDPSDPDPVYLFKS